MSKPPNPLSRLQTRYRRAGRLAYRAHLMGDSAQLQKWALAALIFSARLETAHHD